MEARRAGENWYLAALNDWTPQEFIIELSFLGEGIYTMESASDGINAAKNPHDYRIEKSSVARRDKAKIKLAPGGGYIARIARE